MPTLITLSLLLNIAVLVPVTGSILANPVVLSNLAIAAFHTLTLTTIWKEISL